MLRACLGGRVYYSQSITLAYLTKLPVCHVQTSSHEKKITRGPVNIQRKNTTTATLTETRFLSDTWTNTGPRPEFVKLDTTFSNSYEAYKSKTTSELVRALLVFQLTSFETIVKYNVELMKLLRRVLGQTLFVKLMRNTFYGQFVAGADVNEIKPVIRRNLQSGVKSILDYSVEEDIPDSEAQTKEQIALEYESDMPANVAAKSASKDRYDYHGELGDRRKQVTSARTYFYESEGQCDKNMWTFMKCVDVVAEATDTTGFAAIKLTALGRPQFLLQMSRVLTVMRELFDKLTVEETNYALKRVREDSLAANLEHLGVPISRDETKRWFTWMDISNSGEIDVYSWSNLLNLEEPRNSLFTLPNMKPGMKTGKVEQIFPKLTQQEEREMMNMFRRINTIVEHASELGVRIMVDAEQTYLQPAINRLTMEMMRKFNKDKAVIYNTYQCYLKQAYDTFVVDLDLARREGFYFAAKCVRGAYMDQERERANAVGYEDPINPDFETTSAMYNKVIKRGMTEAKQREMGRVSLMVATHNEDSIRYCVQQMKDMGIRREDKVVCFGQLLGMCDHISFPLGQSGYSVFKYVPYGPVEEVLPYLSRRAAENRGLLKKVKKEKSLLKEEITRRVMKRPTPPAVLVS